MALDHTAVCTAISTKLAAIFTEGVRPGPVPPPQGGPYGKYWYLGRIPAREGQGTLAQSMYRERWQIGGYWPRQTEPQTMAGWEAEIAEAEEAIRTAFEGDLTLGGVVSDLEFESSSTTGVLEIEGTTTAWRVLQLELLLSDLEGEVQQR